MSSSRGAWSGRSTSSLALTSRWTSLGGGLLMRRIIALDLDQSREYSLDCDPRLEYSLDRDPRTRCSPGTRRGEGDRQTWRSGMRVFVTGSSGWIGSAVVPELMGAGHEVTGLARSDASAAALTGAGVRVHLGDLDDPGGLRGAAGASDGVIHLAFNAGMVRSGDFQGAVDADRRAVAALGEALTGSDRPLVIASATVVLAPGRVGTEQDAPGLDPAAADGPRARLATEPGGLSFASLGVR